MTDDDVALDDLDEQADDQLVNDDDGEYEPSSDVVDIDDAMQNTFGNTPDPTQPFNVADEVNNDESDRRDAPDEG